MSTNPEKVYEAAKRSDLEEVKRFLEHEESADSVKKEIAYIAAGKNDLNLLRCVVDKSPSIVKKTGDQNYSVLWQAVAGGALDVVKYLVDEHEADILHKPLTDDRFSTPTVVHLAIEKHHWDILKYFLESGTIDVNTPLDASQRTALFVAVHHGADEHILKYLIEDKNANLTAVDSDGENILYLAARNDDLNFVKYVLDERKAEIDINWRNKEGSTVLKRIACGYGLLTSVMLEYLVGQKQADVNIPDKHEQTPLHCVQTEITCAYLVEHGANATVNKKDADGETPLLKALHSIHDEHDSEKFKIFQYLLKHGADVNVRDKDGVPPLNYATTKWKCPFREKLCELLVEHGTDINQENYFGNTPLHFTIVGEMAHGMVRGVGPDYELFKYFIKHGADVNRADNKGQTPLHWAVTYHRDEMYKYLLKHGADINARNKKGETLVYTAVNHRSTKILSDLVGERHVEVNIAREGDKMTPLHCAASHNYLDICQYLVENGADVLARDKDGRTPVEKASDKQIIELLKTASAMTNRTSRSIVFPTPILLLPLVLHTRDSDKITADVSSDVNRWSVEGASSFVADSAFISRVQSFLALIGALIRPSRTSARPRSSSSSQTNARLERRLDSFFEDMIDRLENEIF